MNTKKIREWMMQLFLLLLISAGVALVGMKKMGLGPWPATLLAGVMFGIGYFAITKLVNAPREMWFTMCLKFLSCAGYKVLNLTVMLWLSHDLGYGKEVAGGIVFAWALTMSISNLLVGSITDAIGVRKTLFCGVTLCILARGVMVFTSNPALALVCGLFPVAVGEAFCTPVLVAALRQFSSPAQRTVAFSLFYAIMNLGFMVANFSFDSVRSSVLHQEGMFAGSGLSEYQALILFSLLIEVCILPFVFLMRTGVEVTEDGLKITPQVDKYPGAGFFRAIGLTARDGARETVNVLGALLAQPGFYRLLVFLGLIGLLKIVFNAMDYVFPPFAMLELGKDFNIGRVNAINSVLILLMAPFMGVVTRRFPAYNMVIIGGFISAFSFIFLVLPTSLFQGAADSWLGSSFGHNYLEVVGPVPPWCIMFALWQILLSVGEVLYSPRVYEYAASIAPRGQEGSYASLSYIPLLLGKLVTSTFGAALLAHYCPETGPRDPSTMWLILGLLVLMAPVGLLLLRGSIRVKEV